MNYAKELDLISKAEERAQTLKKAAGRLKIMLAALEEINQGAQVSLKVDCGKGAEMSLDGVFNGDGLTKHFEGMLLENARRQYIQLAKIYGEDTGTRIETPEKIKTELAMEIPERKAAGASLYPLPRKRGGT